MSELQDRPDAASTAPDAGAADPAGLLTRLRDGATQLRDTAEAAARDGVQRLRDHGDQLHTDIARAADRGADYVRREPLRATLMAAAAGAVVALIVQGIVNARARR